MMETREAIADFSLLGGPLYRLGCRHEGLARISLALSDQYVRLADERDKQCRGSEVEGKSNSV